MKTNRELLNTIRGKTSDRNNFTRFVQQIIITYKYKNVFTLQNNIRSLLFNNNKVDYTTRIKKFNRIPSDTDTAMIVIMDDLGLNKIVDRLFTNRDQWMPNAN